MAFTFAFAPVSSVQAASLSDDQVQAILDLLEVSGADSATISAIQATLMGGGDTPTGGTCDYLFTQDLSMGADSAEVMQVQKFLNGKGFMVASAGAGSPGMETTYFGSLTSAAVAAFQNAYASEILAPVGLTAGTGYWGPSTRAKANMLCQDVVDDDDDDDMDDDDDDFGGSGEGYLDDFERISSYTAEEVGEGVDDVEILGVKFEAKESDQQIQRVEVRVDNPTDTSNTKKLEDVVTELTLWLDGEKIGSMDVEDAGYNRDGGTSSNGLYTFRFTDLDGVVDEGDEGELVVAASGVNNLDSASNQDGFDVFIPENGIRAVSPNGVSDTYDSAAHETTFTVETFASAADLEMKVNLSNDNLDEGVVVVDNEGDDIELVRFTIKADGSDLTIYQLPIALTSANDNIVDITDELVLEWDGGDSSEVVSTAATTGTITFDSLDIDIDDGDTMEFTVTAESATSSVDGSLAITLQGQVTVDDIDAEDATGETVSDADATGSAIGETQHLFTIAPSIEVLDVSIDPIDNGDAAAKSAKAIIKVEVTAEGGTIYLNGDDETTENKRFFVGKVYGSGVTASTTASSTIYSLSGDYTVTNSGADDEYYTLNEDQSMTITIEDTVTQAADATDVVVSAGLKALLFQFGTTITSDTTRSAIDMSWTDLTDLTQTGTASLTN